MFSFVQMCRYQYICDWVRVNEDGMRKTIELKEKKHFQDDYMFGMRQLKGLKLSQIKID